MGSHDIRGAVDGAPRTTRRRPHGLSVPATRFGEWSLEPGGTARYCHPMTAAGSRSLGSFGAGGASGQPAPRDPGGGETSSVAPSRILVLGECLVDLAPAAGAAADRALRDSAGALPDTAASESTGFSAVEGEDLDRGFGTGHPPRQQLVALPGGGPANIAVGLARLGIPCTFAGRFARGGFGPWLRRNLADNGLDLSFSVDADELATIALVTLDSFGRASYTFYGPTTADWQWASSELPDLGREAPGGATVHAVHTGSLVLALEPGASAITNWLTGLRQRGQVLISFDPNVRPGFVSDLSAYRERLTEVVRSSHVVRASTEDTEAVYPGMASRAVAEKWLTLGATLIVITEGADGATAYYQDGTSTHCSPPPIELADTIGAGDAFTSALLGYCSDHGVLSPSGIGHLTEAELRSSVAQAVAAGALTCTRVGADPPNRVDLARFLEERG